MGDRNIIIIGAGIGGLSTACYLLMNGYKVCVLEMHRVPGGLCTAWSRAGYTFDGCIHNLAGTSRDSLFRPIWDELGILPTTKFQTYPELVQVERPDGPPLTVYTDLERLRTHMKSLSPTDADLIDELIDAAHKFGRLDLLGLAAATPLQRTITLLRAFPSLIKYGRVSLAQFAQRFRDPFLRRAFPTLIYDWPQQSMMILLAFLGGLSKGDLGWPVGGSRTFAFKIESRLKGLGGEIRYDTKVQSVLVEDDRAVGVRLADGTEMRADVVISNANGYATIHDMLGGKYTSPAIRRYYGAPEDRIEMGIHVSLGVACDLSREPHAIVLPLDRPETVAGETRDRLYVEPFGFDATLAPSGKSPLKVVLATGYRYWEVLARTPTHYADKKKHIAETIIRVLEKRFPGLSAKVEVVDVATPMTTLKFTGNGHGYRFSMGTMIRNLVTGSRLSQTLPGLADFYMVGQWAGVPGVSVVAAMGRDVARQICRRDGKPFVTSTLEPSPEVTAAWPQNSATAAISRSISSGRDSR